MSELWKELHVKGLKNKGENEKTFLATFASRIPRFTTGCKCREFWSNWIRVHPPTYGEKGEFFEWTVKAHNAVNTKLGKTTISVEEAKKLYSE